MSGPLGMVAVAALGIFALLFGAYINALLVRSRGWKLKEWAITFGQAYWVSLQAGVVAAVVGASVWFAGDFIGMAETRLARSVVALLAATGAWWCMHAMALVTLIRSASARSLKEAGLITTSVGTYCVGALLAIGLCIALAFSLLPELIH